MIIKAGNKNHNMKPEYLTDIFYPSHFYDFMSPVLLNYLAALHGFAPRSLQGAFNYCELGCGGGMTTNTLAAAYPQGNFYGVDMNPAHIAYARQWATDALLNNIQFIEANLCVLDGSQLPEFDFITIHGLYSWVSPKTRRAIVDFIQHKLCPGGIMMISYNAMPGSALIQPIREMMLAYTSGITGDTRTKVDEGIAYLRYLCEHEAAYFRDNPMAKTAVEHIFDRSTDYLAHEFFNAHWTPFYFMEVAETMAAIDLTFVGTLPVHANYLEITIPSTFREFFKTAPDRVVLERHKAFVRNERFRRDVYIKSATGSVEGAARLPLFEAFYFGTEQETVQQEITLQNGNEEIQLSYNGEPSQTIATSLLAHPQTLSELLTTQPNLADFPAEDVLDGINMLIIGDEFRPFVSTSYPLPPDGNRLQLTIPNAFNRRLLEQAHLSQESTIYLASPVIGDGVAINLIEGLLLLGLVEKPLNEVSFWAYQQLEAAGKTLNIEGETIEGQTALMAVLNEQLQKLFNHRISKLIELGILGGSTSD